MQINDYKYVGGELDLFQNAKNWKSYWAKKVRPLIGKEVVEVGAGLGANTAYLCDGSQNRWLCLEPDPAMAARLSAGGAGGDLPPCCGVQCATLRDLPASDRFDTILYIDVLEHIEDDRAELAVAASACDPAAE